MIFARGIVQSTQTRHKFSKDGVNIVPTSLAAACWHQLGRSRTARLLSFSFLKIREFARAMRCSQAWLAVGRKRTAWPRTCIEMIWRSVEAASFDLSGARRASVNVNRYSELVTVPYGVSLPTSTSGPAKRFIGSSSNSSSK